MGIIFDNQSLIPTPFVNVTRNVIRGDDGLFRNTEYVFNLTGTIVNVDLETDSPGASGLEGMEAILNEQYRIRGIFDVDVGLLKITNPENENYKIETYAKPESVTFNEGTWVNRCDYSVVLRSNILSSGDRYTELESTSENWSINENEDQTYTISHQINAKGALIYASGIANNPLLAAKQWVNSRSYQINDTGTLSETISGSGIMNLNNLIYTLPATSNYWNKSIVETQNPITYEYSLTESFIYSPSGVAQEEFSATITHSSDTAGRAEISIAGSIQGNAGRASSLEKRYQNAKTHFETSVESNLYSRSTNFIGGSYTINPQYTSKTVTHEKYSGRIGYNIVFNAISGSTLISNAIDENISITDNGFSDIYATIPVVGRTHSLVQNMSTRNVPKRSLSITATLSQSGVVTIGNLQSMYLAKPNTDAIVSALAPSAGWFFVDSDQEEFSPIKRQYSRSVQWTLVPETSGINGLPNTIHSIG